MPLPTRIEQRIDRSATGCWLWIGAKTTQGYGYLKIRDRKTRVHRVVYELLVGPIPEGLQLDHLCRVRHCVNPDHLEPVTRAENILRGMGASAINARKTHCKNGHEFTPENTLVTTDGRVCRACKRINRLRAARKAAEA